MKKTTDQIKDIAANRWHKDILAEHHSGPGYESAFRLHESAYVSGYQQALRDAKKSKPRPAKKGKA